MLFLKSAKYKALLTLPAMLIVSGMMAQANNEAATQQVQSGYNQLATLLVIVMVVLAFVIWGMGHILTALGRQLVEKNKASKIFSVATLLALTLVSQVSQAQDATVNAVKEIPNYGGLSENAYNIFLTVLLTEVIVILFMAFSIRRLYTELLPPKAATVNKRSGIATWWSSLDKKIFTRAVPVEKETDVLLDHDYDGIKELDNSLPPWWKYGFYITVGVGFIYLLNFHVFGIGLNPTQEYNAEIEAARIKKEIYDANNKDKIDENNVPMASADGIQAGKKLYEANCVACHLQDGGGSVGPNLTDDYWLHKGSLNDIYATIKTGYPDKGMQAWSGNFTPKEISYIASFIKSMHGTKPATPKAPQGDLYTEQPAAGDSSTVLKPDSAAVKK